MKPQIKSQTKAQRKAQTKAQTRAILYLLGLILMTGVVAVGALILLRVQMELLTKAILIALTFMLSIWLLGVYVTLLLGIYAELWGFKLHPRTRRWAQWLTYVRWVFYSLVVISAMTVAYMRGDLVIPMLILGLGAGLSLALRMASGIILQFAEKTERSP